MRSLSIALVALVVAVNGAGLFRDLSGVTTNSLAVTANVTDSSSGWTISNVVAGAQYAADGTAQLPISFNVSFTGTLPDVALFFLRAYVTVSGPGTFPNYNTGASCSPFPGQIDGVALGGGSFARVAGGAAGSLSFSGATVFKLTATGSYTATITLYKLSTQVATGTFTFTASAAATAPTLVTPTISTFYLPASQTNSTPGILTVLTAATFDAAVPYVTSVSFNAPTPQGVVWSTGSIATGGTFDVFSQLSAQVGGWCGNSFVDADILSGTQVFPQSVTLTVGGVTIVKSVVNGGSNSVQVASGNTQFVSTVGSTDVLPPTCTTAQFASTTVVTNDSPVNVVVNTACTDASNALLFSGAFVRATTASFTQDFLLGNGEAFSVYPYLTGSVQIIGVTAVDAVGNAAVYGSCGSLAGQYASLCGGSSASSTVVASLAVVMMCIMAVFAL